MKIELFYLAATAAFTAVLWIPYVLDRFFARGIVDTVGYPDTPKPQSPWAQRLLKAHSNAVENLVVFATLVLVAVAAGVDDARIGQAAMLYFWSRVVHALAFALKLPWIRTLAFLGGFAAQAIVAAALLLR